MHACADVCATWRDVSYSTVGVPRHDGAATLIVRPAFDPVNGVIVDRDGAQAHGCARNTLGGEP
jgi:hypothetical protein